MEILDGYLFVFQEVEVMGMTVRDSLWSSGPQGPGSSRAAWQRGRLAAGPEAREAAACSLSCRRSRVQGRLSHLLRKGVLQALLTCTHLSSESGV